MLIMMINVLGKRLNLKRSLFFFVNLVSTITWYIFDFQFYQLNGGVIMGGPASSTTVEKYIQAHEYAAISTALYLLKFCKQFADDAYSILKRMQLFPSHQQSLSNIKFTMEEERNGEQEFCDTLLKRNNGRISVLVYKKLRHTNQYLY